MCARVGTVTDVTSFASQMRNVDRQCQDELVGVGERVNDTNRSTVLYRKSRTLGKRALIVAVSSCSVMESDKDAYCLATLSRGQVAYL